MNIVSEIDKTIRISIKDALKIWVGNKYTDRDYENYLIMKSVRCYQIFLYAIHKMGGELSGVKQYINLDNDTIDKKYFETLLRKKYRTNVVYTKKIRKVYSTRQGNNIIDDNEDTSDSLTIPCGENDEHVVIVFPDWD